MVMSTVLKNAWLGGKIGHRKCDPVLFFLTIFERNQRGLAIGAIGLKFHERNLQFNGF